MTATRMDFETWKRAVDAAISRMCGLSADDLPDYCYADEYEDGVSAATTAKRAIRAAREY